ncbi:MAG: Uma2 family endonuclease [Planctomycetota bacterium]
MPATLKSPIDTNLPLSDQADADEMSAVREPIDFAARSFIEDGTLRRFTVEDVIKMVETGILPEDGTYELLDGLVVRKLRGSDGNDGMTIGDGHRLAVNVLTELAGLFRPHGCFFQIQQPVQVGERSMPEPDACVVRGNFRDFSSRRPTGPDLLCVMEVADTSLLRDRTGKLALYALAGVPMYVIVDLPTRCVRVHEAPKPDGDFARLNTLQPGDTLQLPTATDVTIDVPVSELFA